MPFLKEKNNMFRRTLVIALLVVLGWSVLVVRLFKLQIIENDQYQKIVISQLTTETKTSAERGKIFDSDMNLLVTNTTVYRVFISPLAIRTEEILCPIHGDTILLAPHEEKETILEFDRIYAGFISISTKTKGNLYA